MSAAFEAPEPGSWEIENTHLSRPITRWLGAVLPPAMMRGFRMGFSRYGSLLEGFDVATVNGFVYTCPRPLGAPKDAKGPPPKLVFKVLSLVHPEFRRRNRRAAAVFAEKAWRDDLRRWDEELSVEIRRTNRALADVDVAAIDDEALANHLADCTRQLDRAIEIHHDLGPCVVMSVGDFVVHAREWTGRPVEAILGLLRGSTPVSAGHNEEMKALVEALAADSVHAALLDSDRPAADVLADLTRAPGAVGEATRAWLSAIGHRTLFGIDLSEVTAPEAPDLLRNVIRAARTSSAKGTDVVAREAAESAFRDAVPDRHRTQFDELLAEARMMNRVRDERTYHNDMWTLGLTRRALLEAGRRLVKLGRIAHHEHAVDLVPTELAPLLLEGQGPSRDEVAERVAARVSRTVLDAPQRLGNEPAAPPPIDWFPPAQARAMRAVDVFITEMFRSARDRAERTQDDAGTIRGLPASPGCVEGRARIVLGPESFGNIELGDVLVARTTSPTYNVLLPMLGGIVTDRGGLLSHAAIVAREYGMPAVVGTSDATKRIRDGARVRLDGARGTVEVVT